MEESIIAIKGNHIDMATEIFETLAYYVDNKNDRSFDSWDKASEYMLAHDTESSQKLDMDRCIWFHNGWTIICDDDSHNFLDHDGMEAISRKINADVFTFFAQSHTYSFAFAKYSPEKTRYFWVTDGLVSDNHGSPLEEESGLNISENTGTEDVVKLAARLGVEMDPEKVNAVFIVKDIGLTEELKRGVIESSQRMAQQQQQQTLIPPRPWWKIW